MMFGNTWDDVLKDEISKRYFSELGEYIQKEIDLGLQIYPDKKDIFKALKKTSYFDTKVVFIGIEPYTNGTSDGLLFSIKEDALVGVPPQLQLIFNAIEEDIYNGFKLEQDPNLERWANQGVLLLHRLMTVQKGKSGSHEITDWSKFIKALTYHLNKHPNPLIFVLFGSKAKELKYTITDNRHLIIELEHPTVAAMKNRAWKYDNCFSRINKFLEEHGKEKIKW